MLQNIMKSHVDCIVHRPVCSVGKLKRIQRGSSDVLQVGQHQIDWCNTVWAWRFFPFLLPEDLAHLIFADLNCRCVGCFFKPAVDLSRIIPLCHSDLLVQCVFGLFIQDFIPLPVRIFFGPTELSEFCSEPWFVVVVG